MKIHAISNNYATNKSSQNTRSSQVLTSFGESETTAQNPVMPKVTVDAIKSKFLSNVSFQGHKEEFSNPWGVSYVNRGSSGAVHTRLSDPIMDLNTESLCGSYTQDEINQKLIKKSSSYYPNSSIENTAKYRTGYETKRVYFADPEEVVPDQTKKDFDYIVYDNRPVYPRLEDVKKNYFGYDYIPSYYWDCNDSAINYGEYFETIADYYQRLQITDKKELKKLKTERAEFENEYQTSIVKRDEIENSNYAQWQKDQARYFYGINKNKYDNLTNKIAYYKNRIKTSKIQEQKALQAFEIFDEVGLMFMDRDSKRKQVADAKATINYDTQKIKEYDDQLQAYHSQQEEIDEQIEIAKEWKALNDKKANSPAQSYDNEHDYYERREKEEYDKKDREYAENESKNLAKKIALWEDKLKKINIKINQLEYCKEVSQNSIKKAQARIPILEAEIKRKSDEIKSYYPKMEEFYKNNVEEWQYNQ